VRKLLLQWYNWYWYCCGIYITGLCKCDAEVAAHAQWESGNKQLAVRERSGSGRSDSRSVCDVDDIGETQCAGTTWKPSAVLQAAI
jgi:hypothetical protein